MLRGRYRNEWLGIRNNSGGGVGGSRRLSAFAGGRKETTGEVPYRKGYYTSMGIALGGGVGVAIGIALDNLALGFAVGPAIGAVIGLVLDMQKGKEPSKET